jgi:hypothetical protein
LSELAAVLLAAFVGAISGVLTTTWKTRKDLEAQYDIDLRKRRMAAYGALWKELEPLADYAPPAELTYDALRTLAESLRRWYFQRGGLVLSLATRGPYFNLQQALTSVSSAGADRGSDRIDKRTEAIVKTLASRLRTSTTEDVATRVGSRLSTSLGTRLERRWRRAVRPVWVSADRRWKWQRDRAEPCYFVLIANRSDREVEVTGIELEGVTDKRVEPELPVVVQAREPRELAVVPVDEAGTIGRVVKVTVTLADRRRFVGQVPPDVPMRTDVLASVPASEPPPGSSP